MQGLNGAAQSALSKALNRDYKNWNSMSVFTLVLLHFVLENNENGKKID